MTEEIQTADGSVSITTRRLGVKLTSEEVNDLAHGLAGDLKRVSDLEAAAKVDADGYRSRIKALEAVIVKKRDLIRSGEEERDVEVRREADYGLSVFHFFRTDTGEEIQVKRMTEEERQRGLFEQGEQDAAVVAAAEKENQEEAIMAEGETAEALNSQEEPGPVDEEEDPAPEVDA